MNTDKLEIIDHESLRRLLEKHDLYKKSGGKSGEMVDLSCYLIEDYDFSGMNLSEIHARSSVFRRCRFVGAKLFGIHFNDSCIAESDLSEATLVKAELINTDARGACFNAANMCRAELVDTNLSGASFRGADLSCSTISGCDLSNTVFDGADLKSADLANNNEHKTSWVDVQGRG